MGDNDNVCQSSGLRIAPSVTHRRNKLVIAHRGASFHLPEHTVPAYRLALELGADFVEPDIVATSDHKLIAIHSLDLSSTTDVETVFPNKKWFSPFAGQEGYWAFNFTLAEIAQLTVTQRLPQARSTVFDNLFKIPLLEEIVQLVNEWNLEELSKFIRSQSEDASRNGNRTPTSVELAGAGIYLEPKELLWHQQEAGIDLVDLLFKHFELYKSDWEKAMPCFQEMEPDTYKVPSLVIQSFELDALTTFHEKWLMWESNSAYAEPPYVLLLSGGQCDDDVFWMQVDETLQEGLLSGIGPEKTCLMPRGSSSSTDDSSRTVATTKTRTKAREYNLAIHPYTSRPEIHFMDGTNFRSIVQETEYLFCTVGVEGIFTESVTTAVSVATAGCQCGRSTSGSFPAFSLGTTALWTMYLICFLLNFVV